MIDWCLCPFGLRSAKFRSGNVAKIDHNRPSQYIICIEKNSHFRSSIIEHKKRGENESVGKG